MGWGAAIAKITLGGALPWYRSSFIATASCLGAAQSPRRVVCLGDSVSQAIEQPLVSELGAKFSVTTISAKASLPTEGELQTTIKAHPDFVLLAIGTDAAIDPSWETHRDRFVPTVEKLIHQLATMPSRPKFFLCLPPPSSLPDSDVRRQRLEFQVTPLLKQAARETGCSVIDFGEALASRLDLLPDGLHPDATGAEILADAVTDAIFTGRKSDWRVVYADSEELDEGPAKNAIDGDPDTYWHTNYSTTADKYPHEIQVDTGMLRTVGGFSYTPRQDGVNGRVANYEFYVSLDGKNWGIPVVTGRFPNGSKTTKVSFAKPVQCRYFRFRALSEQAGQIWASVGELDLIKFYPKRQ